jgi:hypothetical protein
MLSYRLVIGSAATTAAGAGVIYTAVQQLSLIFSQIPGMAAEGNDPTARIVSVVFARIRRGLRGFWEIGFSGEIARAHLCRLIGDIGFFVRHFLAFSFHAILPSLSA